MSSADHLAPHVREQLSFSQEDRIAATLEDQWIGYPRAEQGLQRLTDLINHPPTLRMPNLLLVGESGNGKSTILNRFAEQNPVRERANGSPICPVIVMEMPSEPSETRFWSELLLTLWIAHRDTDSAQRKRSQALETLRYLQCRLLVIDEIHNVLFGHARQQRHFLGVLKNLSNELRVPIVAAGTREAIRTLHTDAQIARRFEAFALPRWKLDREFLRLLASFERIIPLSEPSDLPSRELAIKLHGMSEGTIGELSRLLKRATIAAIRNGEERITVRTLDNLEWVRLADYGKVADAL